MSTIRTLKKGMSGTDVQEWQRFLLGEGFDPGVADRIFGPKTESATKAFQCEYGLVGDGYVGPLTLAKAIELGYPVVRDIDKDWPPKPNLTLTQRQNDKMAKWGRFSFSPAPVAGDKERIIIHGDWVAKNITTITCPIFKRKVSLHVAVAEDYIKLMQTWQKEGLAHLLLTHEGAFAPRFVRGSNTTLSNHSWGTAFDVNYEWNQLGKMPAYVGQKGSVRELVPIANELGWFWGGHFTRRDGMHFEKV